MVRIAFLDLDSKFVDAIRGCMKRYPDLTKKYSITAEVQPIEQFIDDENKSKERVAYISAANSFATMGGGVDGMYNWKMFPQVSNTIQKRMANFGRIIDNYPFVSRHMGNYIPVGSALITSLREYPKYKGSVIVTAPTMMFPSDVSDTKNAHHAFFASLKVINKSRYSDKITTVVCPGLCTGVGGMDQEEAAKQIFEAINDFDKKLEVKDFSSFSEYFFASA